MRYMGSKVRFADELIQVMGVNKRPKSQWYVEPFVGGCNVIEKVIGKRLAGDIHRELIAMYKALQNGWEPPKVITESDYKWIKEHGSEELKAYAGFTHSFAGVYFGTYRRESRFGTGRILKSSYANINFIGKHSYSAIMKMTPKIENVNFCHCPYWDLIVPKNSILYCDPPYAFVSGYGNDFYHPNFWQWARNMVADGHTVYVSEYEAPDDFKCIWSKEVKVNLNSRRGSQAVKKRVEKLFTLKK